MFHHACIVDLRRFARSARAAAASAAGARGRLAYRLAFALTVAVGLLAGQPVYGCSCISVGPACQAFWGADAVMDATVVAVTPLQPPEAVGAGAPTMVDRVVRLDVRQSWKGAQSGPIEVVTSAEESACGFPFKEGERYLVFASYSQTAGRLTASRCSLTQVFSGTGPAADFLLSLKAPARGGRVFGTVSTLVRRFDAGPATTETRTETAVRLVGAGQQRTTSSSGGRYEFTGVPPGSYSIELQVPEGYTTYSPSRQVAISDPRGCAEENYTLAPAGRITGRLVGPGHRPVRQLAVEVTSAATRLDSADPPLVTSFTSDLGDFQVGDLPPGRYIVGVNLGDHVNQYRRYSRAVFPSSGQPPTVVTLALGDAVDIGVWELPGPLAVVKAAGLLTWRDGSPAAGLRVAAWDRTAGATGQLRGAGGTTSGADGRFELNLLEGRIYSFSASDGRLALPVVSPQVAAGTLSRPPIRLVIQRDPPGR